jgi:CRISPR system Cascade subunit CasB
MPGQTAPRPHFWDRHTDGNGHWKGTDRPAGEDLAALRRGLGREAGEVPQMWPFYRELNEKGSLTQELSAEHVALTLFAVHQQGKERPVHRAGIGLGTALLALRHSGKYSPEAIDRRFAAAATATSLAELTGHLRGLITQLRTDSASGQQHSLDYTQLMRDLRDWQRPNHLGRVRRRWGSQYFAPRQDKPAEPGPGAAALSPGPESA